MSHCVYGYLEAVVCHTVSMVTLRPWCVTLWLCSVAHTRTLVTLCIYRRVGLCVPVVEFILISLSDR